MLQELEPMLDLMDGGIKMVLLVIDVQKLIVTEKLYKFDLFVSNIKKLICAARKNKIEVIYVRHDDGEGSELTKGTDEFEIYDEFKPFSKEKIFDKSVNSAFRDTGLLDYLKNKNEKEVIIVGLQSDYCIDATVKCGFEHGLKITVPTYANSTVDNDFMTSEQSYKYYNEYMWKNRYASCISINETIKKMEE
jgi:nicotinamidase-related amidase